MGCAVAQPSLGASPCARNLRGERRTSYRLQSRWPKGRKTFDRVEISAGKIARPRQARTIRRLLTRGRKTQNRSATRSQPRARTGGRRRAPVPHDLRWWRRRDRPARICQFLRRRTNYCTTQDYRSRAAQEHRRARNRDYRIAMASGRAHFISGGAKTTRGVFPANWVVAAFVSNAGFLDRGPPARAAFSKSPKKFFLAR